MFRKELQNGITIITLPAYLTHLSGKMITCELIMLPMILCLRYLELHVEAIIILLLWSSRLIVTNMFVVYIQQPRYSVARGVWTVCRWWSPTRVRVQHEIAGRPTSGLVTLSHDTFRHQVGYMFTFKAHKYRKLWVSVRNHVLYTLRLVLVLRLRNISWS